MNLHKANYDSLTDEDIQLIRSTYSIADNQLINNSTGRALKLSGDRSVINGFLLRYVVPVLMGDDFKELFTVLYDNSEYDVNKLVFFSKKRYVMYIANEFVVKKNVSVCGRVVCGSSIRERREMIADGILREIDIISSMTPDEMSVYIENKIKSREWYRDKFIKEL